MADSNTTMFSYLTNILRLKSPTIYARHVAEEGFESLYVPFMVTKWCSMVNSSGVAEALSRVQSTLDWLADSPALHYRMLLKTLPKVDETPRWVFDRPKKS